MLCLGTEARITQKLFPCSRTLERSLSRVAVEREDRSAPQARISAAFCGLPCSCPTRVSVLPPAAQAGAVLNLTLRAVNGAAHPLDSWAFLKNVTELGACFLIH